MEAPSHPLPYHPKAVLCRPLITVGYFLIYYLKFIYCYLLFIYLSPLGYFFLLTFRSPVSRKEPVTEQVLKIHFFFE